tara:strand:+ start:87 stop:956 length:870 start_codon:yes stop_codon:yes gene_type:complete
MRYLIIFSLVFLTSCETMDSVQSSIYKGMTKSKFCEATGLVMVNEDPCFGKTYTVNSNTEIITNNIESQYYIFKNNRLSGTARNYYAAITQINDSSEYKQRSINTASNSNTSVKPKTSTPSYSNNIAEAIVEAITDSPSSTSNNYQCRSARSELDFANKKLSQARNYYNINSISCNNTGRSCMVMPQQCQNRAYQCQNRSTSCRAGDYTCTNREYSRYNQCRSSANNEYNQCQSRARQAAENQRRNCENQKANAKSQCLSRVKRNQNNLISQANALQSNANRKISQACN